MEIQDFPHVQMIAMETRAEPPFLMSAEFAAKEIQGIMRIQIKTTTVIVLVPHSLTVAEFAARKTPVISLIVTKIATARALETSW